MLSKSLAEIVDEALRQFDRDFDEIPAKYRFPQRLLRASGTKQRKCVHFPQASLAKVCETISRFDMTPEEHEAYWWTSADQEEIRRRADSLISFTRSQRKSFVRNTLARALEIVSSIVDGSNSGDYSNSQHCYDSQGAARGTLEWVENCNARRGLEQYINEHPIAKKIVLDHRQAVIHCALRCGSDQERVRNVSKRFSAVSVGLAHLMGKADARFVSQGLNNATDNNSHENLEKHEFLSI
jgi:hypothetical protein